MSRRTLQHRMKQWRDGDDRGGPEGDDDGEDDETP